MLPPFIIEQIRQREEEKQERVRPGIELPLEIRQPSKRARRDKEKSDRGVVVIDL